MTLCSLRAAMRFSGPLIILAFIALAACQERTPETPRSVFRHAAVVCADSLAAEAGVRVLHMGGNAVDAAVAIGFALAVTYPEAGNIGGGGFMLVRMADGTSGVIDFREVAPSGAYAEMFLDSAKQPIPGKSLKGPLSAGVPGTVSGLLLALSRYGSTNRSVVLDDAIRLAEEGFPISPGLARSLKEQEDIFRESSSASRVFLEDDETLREGDTLRQTDLARTLRRIRETGREGFYDGDVAELIVLAMEPGGGMITRKDLAGYQAVERKAVQGSYRDCTVLTVPPPSSGGIILIQILNTLELFDISGVEPGSAPLEHLVASSAARSFADRSLFAADPEAFTIPVNELITKEYAAHRAKDIMPDKATPAHDVHPGDPMGDQRSETTHYAVIDSSGNVASVTVSLNDVYGGKVYVRGAGFFLNDVMDDFVIKPGTPNFYGLSGGEKNSIAPGRRMVSSMTPVIMLRDEKPLLVIGARGGSRIPTAVAQVILNVVDYGMDLEQAVELPRIHYQWDPDVLYFEEGLPGKTLEQLSKMGYEVAKLTGSPGRVQALAEKDGVIYGMPDPREGGMAAGF